MCILFPPLFSDLNCGWHNFVPVLSPNLLWYHHVYATPPQNPWVLNTNSLSTINVQTSCFSYVIFTSALWWLRVNSPELSIFLPPPLLKTFQLSFPILKSFFNFPNFFFRAALSASSIFCWFTFFFSNLATSWTHLFFKAACPNWSSWWTSSN